MTMSSDTEFFIAPWPTSGRSHAGAFSVRTQRSDGVERTFWCWFDDVVAPSAFPWPGSEAGELAPIAQLVPATASVLVTRQDVAQEDVVLADVRVADDLDLLRAAEEGTRLEVDGFERAIGTGCAHAMIELQKSPRSKPGADPVHVVTSLQESSRNSAPRPDLDLNSWHCVTEAGLMLRALERLDPVLDIETGDVRARRFLVILGGRTAGELAVPNAGLARWWPADRSPMIDDPVDEPVLPHDISLLLSAIRG